MGVYVSSVDHGSTAHKNGLTVGDLLLEANNISFRGIPHQEAVKVDRKKCREKEEISGGHIERNKIIGMDKNTILHVYFT